MFQNQCLFTTKSLISTYSIKIWGPAPHSARDLRGCCRSNLDWWHARQEPNLQYNLSSPRTLVFSGGEGLGQHPRWAGGPLPGWTLREVGWVLPAGLVEIPLVPGTLRLQLWPLALPALQKRFFVLHICLHSNYSYFFPHVIQLDNFHPHDFCCCGAGM